MRSNVRQVAEVLDRLAHAYPGTPVDGVTLDLWAERLVRHDVAALNEAAGLWITSQPRFPAISEFVSTVQGVARRRAGVRISLNGRGSAPSLSTEQQAMTVRLIREARAFVDAHADEYRTSEEKTAAMDRYFAERRSELGLTG